MFCAATQPSDTERLLCRFSMNYQQYLACYEHYGPTVYGLCLKHLGDKAEAAPAVMQQVFTSLAAGGFECHEVGTAGWRRVVLLAMATIRECLREGSNGQFEKRLQSEAMIKAY